MYLLFEPILPRIMPEQIHWFENLMPPGLLWKKGLPQPD
jgi:hypothetical protein